ncbi:MAG: imidazoleglycerol-phosphate dehydratase HisB [Chloroflexi bacterium]|nr:imidazoleglycerol-phosphate dehydratase HisB [Chloroflexota bacterium]
MRRASVHRKTRETDISITLDLDGQGSWRSETGVPFMDHMLSLFAAHSMLDMEISAQGDTAVDDHHTVEDTGIVLGQALASALGDRTGIVRYGSQLMPMDEALVLVSLDFSGRGLLVYDVPMPASRVGSFDTELVSEFLRALASHAGMTLHVQLMHGANSHHIIEAVFKGFGRALRQAVSIDPRQQGVPSTKGTL